MWWPFWQLILNREIKAGSCFDLINQIDIETLQVQTTHYGKPASHISTSEAIEEEEDTKWRLLNAEEACAACNVVEQTSTDFQ